MKNKLIYIIILSLLLPLAQGCSLSGSIYENYRELEQIRLIEVMGIDSGGDGTTLSIAAGPGVGENASPVLMHATSSGITGAISTLQDYAASEDLYYAHTQYLIFGSGAAGEGLERYLDYIDRSPMLRMGISMYVVRGGTAQELVDGTGGESYDVSAVLASLERDAEKRGEVCLTTCRDVVRRLSRSGAALAVALEIRDMDKVSSEAEGGGKTAIPTGYCVIRGGRTAGWILGKPAAAVGMLTNRAAALPVSLSDGQGGQTEVTLTGCKCAITPVWENGRPVRFDVSFRLKSAIVELENPETLLSTGSPEELARRLESTVCEWAETVLNKSRELKADFLGLGVMAQRAEPKQFSALNGSWPEQLAQAEFRVTAEATVERSYDLTRPAQTEGRETA